MIKPINGPLVSVVIPSYNRGHCIADAIATVHAQVSFQPGDIEIVVVDDCSKDNTQEVLKKLQTELPNLKVIRHSENRGVGAARNTGIRESTGEFIAFLDSDDTWHPAKLSLQLGEIFSEDYLKQTAQIMKEGRLPALDDHVVSSILQPSKTFCMTYYSLLLPSGEITVDGDFIDRVDECGNQIPKVIYTSEELRRGTATLGKWFGVGSTLFAHRDAIKGASDNGVFFHEGFGFGEDSEPLIRHVLRGGDIKVVPFPLMTYKAPPADKIYPGWEKRYPLMAEEYRCDIATVFDPDAALEFVVRLRRVHNEVKSQLPDFREVAYELTAKADSPCVASGFDCSLYGKLCRPFGVDPGAAWASNRAMLKAIKCRDTAHQVSLLEPLIGIPAIAEALDVTERTVLAWKAGKREPFSTKSTKVQAALQTALYLQERGIEVKGYSIADWFRRDNPSLGGMSPLKAIKLDQSGPLIFCRYPAPPRRQHVL